jgi:N-methylhydantoinase A
MAPPPTIATSGFIDATPRFIDWNRFVAMRRAVYGRRLDAAYGNGHRVAVDVGGTFIDFALLDEATGTLTIEKQPATASRLAEELLTGLGRLPVTPADIGRLFHGTTVAINAVLQERGVRVGLLTTHGFRDVLALGRGARPEIYNFFYSPPESLVPRYLRREVTERTAADGSELEPLALDEVDRELERLLRHRVEAVAVCFLHSYANPAHERQAVERIRATHPELSVTASSEVATEWREFERTSTTVLNSYIQPPFASYLGDLTGRLRDAGYTRPFALMQSNGGVIDASRAAQLPIRTLESGPAGGVIGARALAAEIGYANVICADVGGTSYDVALIEDGHILERTDTKVGGRPVVGPGIDIVSIGAGGGSIAWIDHRGAVKVGPQSAGAHPGPACFGLGGEEPTVTDCHLVLGRLDPDNFLGSRMHLDVDAAQRAILTRIAEPIGATLEQAADGILSIAETNMTYAIRAITVERGLDPREFALFSYGGGGGLFAAATAEELEIPTVVVPRAPANFSAWGILTSDYRDDAALTRVRALDASSVGGLVADLRVLAERATTELRAYGFDESELEYHYRTDARYAGQEHTITAPIETEWIEDEQALLPGLRERFVELHRQLYGHGEADAPLEVVTVRCRAVGRVGRPRFPEWQGDEPAAPVRTRSVYFRGGGGFVDTPVFDREQVARDQVIEGPAIVEEWTTTIVVSPDWHVRADRLGDLVLENGRGG